MQAAFVCTQDMSNEGVYKIQLAKFYQSLRETTQTRKPAHQVKMAD